METILFFIKICSFLFTIALSGYVSYYLMRFVFDFIIPFIFSTKSKINNGKRK